MDFLFVDHGSVSILTPLTEEARSWVEENVQVEQTLGRGIAIDHRYVKPILEGIRDAGLSW